MSTTAKLSEEVRRLSGLVADLRRERDDAIRSLSETQELLETERLRLAACSTAALGYFDGCHEDYKSAALGDVLDVRKRLEEHARKLRESTDYAESLQRAVIVMLEAWPGCDSRNPENMQRAIWAVQDALSKSENEIGTINGGLHSRHSTHASAAHGDPANADALVRSATSATDLSSGGNTALPASADPHPFPVHAVGNLDPGPVYMVTGYGETELPEVLMARNLDEVADAYCRLVFGEPFADVLPGSQDEADNFTKEVERHDWAEEPIHDSWTFEIGGVKVERVFARQFGGAKTILSQGLLREPAVGNGDKPFPGRPNKSPGIA